jgi:hypothetical protein
MAFGRWGLPASARVGPADFELRRHALGLESELLAWTTGNWSLRPLLRGAVLFLRRDIAAARADILPAAPARQRTLLVGAGSRLAYRLSPFFGLSLRAVLNWQSSTRTYSVIEPTGETVSSDAAWPVQPSLEMGANWFW